MDEAYREKVYRLVYAVSQFPVMRQYVGAEGGDSVAELLRLLWGAGGASADPEVIMATLLRANADDAVRRLVEQADLKKVIEAGLQRGFYLTDRPPGLRWGNGTLRGVRDEARSAMTLARSTTDALNERLESQSNALWFEMEAQQLRSKTEAFEAEMVPLQTLGVDVFRNSRAVDRATRQFLTAELGAAIGMLQVVVLDDTTTSSTARAFRNVYAREASPQPGSVLEQYTKVMRKHDLALRGLRRLTEVALLTSTRDSPKEEYDALWTSVGQAREMTIPLPGGRDKRLTVTDKEEDYYKSSYRGLFDMLTGLGRAVRKKVEGATDSWRPPSIELMRYVNWLVRYVFDLRAVAGKVFVFYLPSKTAGEGDRKRMHPSWHLYAGRDWKEAHKEDEAAIKDWIAELISTDRKGYSPSEQKKVGACEGVVGRAADVLGIEGTTKTELVELACKDSGSCLDKQYLKVRDNNSLKDADDRSNALARSLLQYGDISCDENTLAGSKKTVQQVLCEHRVDQACAESSASCGANSFPGSTPDDKVQALKIDVCTTPRARQQLSAKCALPDRIDDRQRTRQDAACIRNIVNTELQTNATCETDLKSMCSDGSQGNCLIEAVEQKRGPDSCVNLDATGEAQELLKRLDVLPASERSVCKKLLELSSDKVNDDRLREVAARTRKNIQCDLHERIDLDNLSDFNNYVQTMRKKDQNPGGFPGGLLISNQEYHDAKRKYSKSRHMNPDSRQITTRLSNVFQMVEVQSHGMEGISAPDIVSPSRFRHRMLFAEFERLISSSPPLYQKVVGREYVDWILMAASHYTKSGWGAPNEKAKEAIRLTIGAIDTALSQTHLFLDGTVHKNSRTLHTSINKSATNANCKRGWFFMDSDVRRYLYERLSRSVTTPGEDDDLTLSIELIVQLNTSRFIEAATGGIPDVDEKWDALRKNLKAPAHNHFTSIRRTVSSSALQAIDSEEYSRWWRQILLITLFAPESNMATEYIASKSTEDMSKVPWNVLYAALVCISVSSSEVFNASTHILIEMSRRRDTHVIGSEEKLRALGQKIKSIDQHKLDRTDMFHVFEAYKSLNKIWMQERTPLKVTSFTPGSNVDNKLNAHGYIRSNNGTITRDGGIVSDAHLLFAFVHGISETNEDDISTFFTQAMLAYSVVSEQSSEQIEKISRQLTQQKASKSTMSKYIQEALPFIVAATSAVVSPVFTTFSSAAVGMTSALMLGTFQKLLARFRFGDTGTDPWSDENLKKHYFVTPTQGDVAQKFTDENHKQLVLHLDICLTLLTTRYDVYDKRIQHPEKLEELIHIARLGAEKPDAFSSHLSSTNPTTSLEMKEVTTFESIMPCARVKYHNGTFSAYEQSLISEYAQALAYAIPAYLMCENEITTDSGFTKAMFFACYPAGTFDIEASDYVNPMLDVPFKSIFAEEALLHSVRRLNVWTLAKRRPHGMHYFALTKSEETEVNNIIQKGKLGSMIQILKVK